ncbi:MAG: lysine--tRNA ligase [Patescibacteria group bacterium]
MTISTSLQKIRKDRIDKAEKLRKIGINPYPAKSKKNNTCSQMKDCEGKDVCVAGRLRALRGHGGSLFADIFDITGKTQIFFSEDLIGEEKYKLLELIDIGDFIEVEGNVFKTKAGEITVKANDFNILTKAIRPLPEKWHGLSDVETRLRKRYLDLIMNPEIKEMFIKKTKFWTSVRKYLSEQNFLEVETPTLEITPGGADANPFITHHDALDTNFYLRISLELHLKRLIVGGFEKIFEIGRVFRNEGIDAQHLQDYTQMEFYWAYADYEDLMDLLEDFYKFLVKETVGSLKTLHNGKNIDWSKKWERLDYNSLFKEKVGLDLLTITIEDLKKKAKELNIHYKKNMGKGRLIDLIYKRVIRPGIVQPSFLINLPVEISPLAKRKEKDSQLTQRIIIVANGYELGNGFSELNDPVDQENRFKEQQKLRDEGDDEAQMYDKDFVEALEYGMPPTAGFGMSERLFSFLMDKPIRECVFFPMMRKDND